MAIHVHFASLLLLATIPVSAQTAPAPNADTVRAPAPSLLGQGWGVDHVGVAVRDLAQAQHDYERLGFKFGTVGHFPDGVSNAAVSLQNNSYLELLGSTPGGPGSDIADYVKKHEGAMFLGIDVSSAKAAADYLRARNFAVWGPLPGSVMKEGETTPPPPQWYTVGPSGKPAAGKKGITVPIFWIEYLSTERPQKRRAAGLMDHPNTALGIHAVWFAVHDAEAQLRTLRDAGFEVGDPRKVKVLRARGREVKAGQGVLLLLGSSEKNGLLTRLLSDHDEDIIGLSIEVADLGKARQLAESGTAGKLKTYKGSYGTSFLLPPEVTHGIWLEMFQR
jgi:catechol 2,3-dioxygenase-like lactoylglutathione lyase family enzyme